MTGEGRDWETESRPTEAHAAVKTDPNAGCAIGADGITKHSLALVVGMRPHRKHAGAPPSSFPHVRLLHKRKTEASPGLRFSRVEKPGGFFNAKEEALRAPEILTNFRAAH